MSGQVLLVGHESSSLRRGARRSPAGSKSRWTFSQTGNGTQALEFVDQNPMDAVVADTQLPDMSGLRFLDGVMKRHPEVLRLMLVDVNTRGTDEFGVSAAHFLLPKPFSQQELEQALDRVSTISAWFQSKPVLETIRRLRRIPSPPRLYYQILAELKSSSASVEKWVPWIERDQAVSARLLWMANSSAFRLPRVLGSVSEAVTVFGPEAIASLVLLAQMCAQFDGVSPGLFSVDDLCRHSLASGRLAHAIARAERMNPERTDQSFTGGLLHDVGKFVLAANVPEIYARIQAEAQHSFRACWSVERETFGVTHAEIGGWLAGIWGVPSAVVQALAFHHQPELSETDEFQPVDSVHAANLLEHRVQGGYSPETMRGLDFSYLVKKGLPGRETAWVRLAQDLFPSPSVFEDLTRPLAA